MLEGHPRSTAIADRLLLGWAAVVAIAAVVWFVGGWFMGRWWYPRYLPILSCLTAMALAHVAGWPAIFLIRLALDRHFRRQDAKRRGEP